MERTYIERRVYGGTPTKRGYAVSAVKYQAFERDHRLKCTDVKSLEDYSAGCREHANCFGHMCVTNEGNILPPHSLSMRSGPIATEYLKASMLAFERDKPGYIAALKRTNYSKHGHMRSIMSSPIAGSARLVAVPQVDLPRDVICLPQELMRTLIFCAYEKTSDGDETGYYKERCLQDGDYVLLVRPPSLTWESVQPVRVATWDRPAIGIKPELFSAQHGDYDGDEAHIYPVTSNGSLWEAQHWVSPRLEKFDRARQIMKELGMDDTSWCDDHSKFINYTTLSAKQLHDGGHSLTYGNYSRNSDQHVSDMAKRSRSTETESSFIHECIRGTGDIVRQQLPQSSIGEMSRNSKVSSSSFYRTIDGDLCVQAPDGVRLLAPAVGRDPGSPANRAIMLLCSKAQQSALDSHRVGSKANRGFDFISDMLAPNEELIRRANYTTLCLMSGDYTWECDSKPRWMMRLGDKYACLMTVSQASLASRHIAGAYSPSILSLLPSERRSEACKLALELVMSYYDCKPSEDELHDLSICLSYQTEATDLPLTTRPGTLRRDLGWIEQLFCTDYSKLPSLQSFEEHPETSTSAMYMANFSRLTARFG